MTIDRFTAIPTRHHAPDYRVRASRNTRHTACALPSTSINSRLTCDPTPVLRHNQGSTMPTTRSPSTTDHAQQRTRRATEAKKDARATPGSLRRPKARTPQNRGSQGVATKLPRKPRGRAVPVPKPHGQIQDDNNRDNNPDNKVAPCFLVPINNKPPDTPVRHLEYRLSERVVLIRGDKIRVSSGPYYDMPETAGHVTRMKMGERGVMTFLACCELGNTRWIEAYGKSGFAALRISSDDRGGWALMPGFVRRPYKITKVKPRKSRS